MSCDTPLIVAGDLTKRFKNSTDVDASGLRFIRRNHRSPFFAFPAAVLAAMSFSALFVCVTTFVRKLDDFDIVVGLAVMPMFLFSGTFFPVSRVPLGPRIVIECLPLYHGTAMLRQLTTGAIDCTFGLHVAYLASLGVAAFVVALHRLDRALIK